MKKVVEIWETKERELKEKRLKMEICKLQAEEKVNKVLASRVFLPSSWIVDNLKSVAGSLKRDGDDKLPSRTNNLLDRLYKTVHRDSRFSTITKPPQQAIV